jgi:hypothetical protein
MGTSTTVAPSHAAPGTPVPVRTILNTRLPDAEDEEAGETPGSGPERERAFFERWLGKTLTSSDYKSMWDAAMRSHSEPAVVGATNAFNSWQQMGPIYSVNPGGGQMTGRVRDIDAINHRVLAASGGLWRFNFGAIAMTDSVPATWFGAFASPPNDPNTILLGTGELIFGQGTGLYRTTDGGATWTPIAMSPPPSQFAKIRYSPSGAIVNAATDNGLYRSTDGGLHWTRTYSGFISDLAIVNDTDDTLFSYARNVGFLRSNNGGQSWLTISPGANIAASATGLGAITATRPSASQPLSVFGAFENTLFIGLSGGRQMQQWQPPLTIGVSGYGPAMSVCPSDPKIVLYGNVGIYRSVDAGLHWAGFASADLHADYHVFQWDADGVGVWAGNDGGWSHSTDKGVTWSSASNVMPISQFYRIDCERTEAGVMLGGTQDNNILITPNEALFWSDPALYSSEGDAQGVVVDPYSPNRVFGVSGVGGPPFPYTRFRSMDFGAHWAPATTGMAATNSNGDIVCDQTFPLHLYMSAGTTVYESTDSALTWQSITPSPFLSPVTSLTATSRVSPSAVLYACTSDFSGTGRLIVRDGGAWSSRGGSFPDGPVVRVVPHPWFANASTAWALVNSSTGHRIYRTDDRGVTWTDITGDFPLQIPISDIVCDPRNPTHLYLGTFLGCYRTLDGGAHWDRWNNGMPISAKVTSMSYIDMTSTTGQFFVVAATYGHSVFKRDISGDDPVPTVSAGTGSVAEGDAGQAIATVPITLSAPYFQTVSVTVSTADGTALLADNDYVATTTTVSFPPGQTSATFSFAVNGDTQIEPDETVAITLSAPIRCVLGSNGTATIQDDDMRRAVLQNLPGTDGTVYAIASQDNRVYVGGSFGKVGPTTGGAVPVDGVTGLPRWLPRVAGSVLCAAPDGAGGWYLGGVFTHVGGQPRTNLAHVLADHTLAAWNPMPNAPVLAMVLDGPRLSIGGNFTSVGVTARTGFAQIDANTGAVQAYDLKLDGSVFALVHSADTNTLYVGGSFSTALGVPRSNLLQTAATSAFLVSWNPNVTGTVNAMVLGPSVLYVGGALTSVGVLTRNHVAAIGRSSGTATAWDPAPDAEVDALALDGANVYLGGLFANVHGSPRSCLAAVDTASGLPTAFAPNPDVSVSALAASNGNLYVGGSFSTIATATRHSFAAFDLATLNLTAWDPDANGPATGVVPMGSDILALGDFNLLKGTPRGNLAAFDATTGALLPWNPNADGTVFALAAGASNLFVGGNFSNVGGAARVALAAVDSSAGLATSWTPTPSAGAVVRALWLTPTRLYAGGTFATMNAASRSNAAAFDPTTGALQSWAPVVNGVVNAFASDATSLYMGGAFTTVSTISRPGLAAVALTNGAVSPFAVGTDRAVLALYFTNNVLYVGGAFNTVNSLSRPRVVAVSTLNNAVSTWTPSPGGNVSAIAPQSSSSYYFGGSFSSFQGQSRSRFALARPVSSTLSSLAPEPDGTVNSIVNVGSTVFVGGSFRRFGGLAQAGIAALVPTSTVDVPAPSAEVALALTLSPNPSTGPVHIAYALPQTARVRIAVFDVLGRRIAQPLDAEQPAGTHELVWSASAGRLAPGIYLVRLEAGERHALRRCVIMK